MIRLKRPLSVWMLRLAFIAAAATVIPACGRANPAALILPFAISTASLPSGSVTNSYNEQLMTQSQTDPVAWSVFAGSLPSGMTLGGTGLITGTPTGSASSTTFTVRAIDALGQVAQRSFQLTINGGAPAGLAITTTSPLPGGDLSTYYDFGFSAAGGTPGYTWTLFSGAMPPGLTLNPANGGLTGTPISAGLFNFTVRVTDTVPNTVNLACALTIAPALTITSSTLPQGTVGVAYTQPVPALNGTAPLLYSLSSGAMPAGLALNPGAGTVTGTPTAAGPSAVVIRVTDVAGVTQLASLSITINPAPTVVTAVLPPSTQGLAYNQTLIGTPGTLPLVWTVSAGGLPSGLTLSSGGVITGTSTVAGTFNFTALITDAAGGTASRALSILINPPVVVTNASLAGWTVNRPSYTQPLTSSGGTGAIVFSITGGTLPAGLILNPATGVISGTPTAVATSSFTVVATDTLGATGNKPLSITINLAPTISTASLPNWTVNRAYTATPIAVTNGTAPFGYSVTVGALPAGMTLGAATGIVAGTPTTPATSNFTITVVDAAGASTLHAYTVIIYPTPVVSTASVPSWTINRLYPSQTMALSANTGTAPFTWAVTGGAAPTGLTLNAGTGVLSGTPTATGPFTFTVTVTDAAGATAPQTFTAVTINPPPTIATALPDWTIGRAYSQTLLATAATGTAPYTFAITAGTQPTSLALSAAGVMSGTPTVAGPFTFTVTITDTAGATGTRTYTNMTINPTPTVATTTLPDWTISRPYSQTLLTTPATGTAPFNWAITSGTQPTSLLLSAGGVLSGTPSATGPFTFTVTVTDTAGATATQTYTAEKINPLPTIVVTTMPNWTVNRVYPTQTLLTTAATGTAPFTWAITAGAQPTSLSLTSGGVLSGTPTVAGTYSYTVTVTDAAGATVSQAYNNVVINPPPTIATALPDWTVSRPYSQTLLTTPATGTAPFTWAITAGTQPTSLLLNAAGLLSGTPSASGPFTFTVTVTDTAGATGIRSYSPLTINPLPTVATTTLPDWTVSVPYSQTVLTTPATGTAPFTWAITSGTQPTSLFLSAGGVLSGTPSASGPFTFTVTVTDTAGATAPQTYTALTINPPVSITTTSPLAPWTRNFAGYNQALNATGGTGAKTWSLVSGSFPAGLIFNAAGSLTGTPTAAPGIYTAFVQATDTVGGKGAPPAGLSLSITVNPPLVVTSGVPLAPWTQGKSGYSQTVTATGGTGVQSWSLSPGPLPTSLTMSPGGNITGTPSAAGTYPFTLLVTDSIGATGSLPESILINPPLVITTSPVMQPWTQNFPGYSQTVTASGGTGAQTFTLSPGPLPTGLFLSAGGAVTGTPTVAGNANFTVQVTDAVGATGQNPMSININPPVSITTSSPLPDGALSVFYNTIFSSSGGTGGITWTTTTTPPNPVPGLTLSGGGSLSGLPTVGGNFIFSVIATDSLGASSTVPSMNLFILAPLTITSTDPLAAAVANTVYGPVTLTGTGGRGTYTWSLVSGTIPNGINLSAAGVLSGTPPLADNNGTYNFTVKVTDADGRTAIKALSITLTGGTAAAISQTPTTLPGATQNAPYDRGITATGGTPGYTWTVAAFAPGGSGLSLGTNGHVTGTAGTPGTYTVSSLVTDALAATNTQTITVTVNPPLSITTTSPMPSWTVLAPTPYSQSISIAGGTAPFTGAIASGSLPPGLTLNTGTGAITGTPTSTGTFAFTAQVSDSAGATALQGLQITINPAVSVGNFSTLPQWDQNLPGYSQSLFASGGTGPFTWLQTGGAYPTGLLPLTSGGGISGTPTAVGTFSFTAQVTDAAGSVASKLLSITINTPVTFSTPSIPGGTENVAYNQSVSAGGGSPGYNFALTGGTLPTGMSFSGSTFSGTPAGGTAATYSPQITVTDFVGGTNVKTYTLVIGNTPAVLTSSPGNGDTNVTLDTNLVITFNMAMVKTEVESRFTISLLASAVHSYFWDTPALNPNGTTLTVALDTVFPWGVISADDLLSDNHTYSWAISSGAHSASALVMPLQSGTFTTIPDGTPPTLVSITPDPAAILTNVTGFVIVFNEAMDQTGSNGQLTSAQIQGGLDSRQANAGTTSGPITVQWTNSTTLTLGFSPALTGNTGYLLQVQNLRDVAGNYMTNDIRLNVVTSGSGSAAPTITANYPPNGATNVSRDTGMFVGISEALSPNLPSVVTVTPAVPAVQIRYELGKNDGPLGFEITPRAAWPPSTLVTVTIPVTVTNASGIPLAAPFSFSFTTGTTGVGTNPIVIDDPYSTIKNNMVDCNSFGGLQGQIFFKDSVTGARVYLDNTTLVNQAISVTDPSGIPVKLLSVNSNNNNGGGIGQSLQISNLSGQGLGGLQQSTAYTLTMKSSIAGSAGQTFAGAIYTFTTASNTALTRAFPDFQNNNANTDPGPPNPKRTVDLQVNLNQNGGGTSIQSVANAVAGTTDYTANGFVAPWIIPGVNMTITGCSNSVNNGTFLVTAVSGGSPTVITVNNSSGVTEGSGGQMGAPYVITVNDITPGNSFTGNLLAGNNGYEYQSATNESGISTDGDHVFQYSITDGVAAHDLLVDQSNFFYSGPEMSALTLTSSSPPGGPTPTYSWSGTTPASVTALFVSVSNAGGKSIYGWIIPPSATSFTQPANSPLPPGTYSWTLGFFHSGDGTIRDNNGGNGNLLPISFSR